MEKQAPTGRERDREKRERETERGLIELRVPIVRKDLADIRRGSPHLSPIHVWPGDSLTVGCSSAAQQDDNVDEEQANQDEREVDEELLQVPLGLRVHLDLRCSADGRLGHVLDALHGDGESRRGCRFRLAGGLFEEVEINELTSDQPGSLLKSTDQMLRIEHMWRYEFSSLAACFSNIALNSNMV